MAAVSGTGGGGGRGEIHVDTVREPATVAGWQSLIGGSVTPHPVIPTGTDPASLAAAARAVDWEADDAAEIAERAARAGHLGNAASTTVATMDATDTASASAITGSVEDA